MQPRSAVFGQDPIQEIFLPRAPLLLTLAQVRFPHSPELLSDENLGQIRDDLKADYPIMREEKALSFVISPNGALTEGPPTGRIIRFKNKTETWQFSVGQDFMSLHTSAYTSREDFCSRFENVIRIVSSVASPIVIDRVGIRYINRFADDDLSDIGQLIAEPFLGLLSLDLTPAEILQNFTQTILRLEEGHITSRWGLVPEGTIIDTSLAPLHARSWILDVDVYQERKDDFVAVEIGQHVRRYADLAYRFFRLAVTDRLLNRAGDSNE
jgi:uncharacterized protein (TIGR04255 family)